MSPSLRRIVTWPVLAPVLAVVVLAAGWGRPLGAWLGIAAAAALVSSVLAAVHHAEVVAHRVGEPFGSLVLAVAVTIIEVGLIVSLMVSGSPGSDSLARDTVFAALMITTNGILGLSLLIGSLKRGLAVFNAEGTGAALATVITLATLSLVLPTVTTSLPGPQFSGSQLVFAAVASLALYGLFVFTQTVRHRDFFLPVADHASDGAPSDHTPAAPTDRAPAAGDAEHAPPPSAATAWGSLALLVVALVAVVGLAHVESPAIEDAVAAAGLPHAVVGIVIAMLVLAPETLAAARAATRDRIQISLNLALGSAMASIGLTIPTIAVASIWLDGPLLLGLGSTHLVLLALTAIVGVLTVVPGRSTRLNAAVHLVILAAFLFLAVVP